MSAYTILDAAGEIVSVLDAPDATHLAANIPAGGSPINGAPPRWDAYYTAGVWITKPAQPSPWSVWNATTKRWTDPRTLDQAKADRWEFIKAARAAAIDAPLTTPLGTFDCDAASRANILGAVVLAQTLTAQSQPAAIAFTLSDNTVVTLNAAQMTTVGLSLGSKTQAAYTRGQTLRIQIDAATSNAALQAIVW